MRMLASLALLVCTVALGQLSPVPPPSTALPSHPFFITKTWVIGGVGDWDYLTMDPMARELFIAHGPTVQVVNVDTGTVTGTVRGLHEAHAVVLDEQGAYGYVSDGQANMVRVFDRHSFQVVASILTATSPRSMVLDPSSGLLFVIGSQPTAGGSAAPPATRSGTLPRSRVAPGPGERTAPHGTESTVTVIDVEHRTGLAQIVLPGALGFAKGDGNGGIFVTVADRNQIMRLNAQAIGNALHGIIDANSNASGPATSKPADKALVLDWTPRTETPPPAEALPHAFPIDAACQEPRALAVDSAHQRLFVACNNFRMVVLNPQTGQAIAALPVGPGPDAIGYDPNRGLIFTANGDGDGSLTIIRQDVTDTYSVIQTLPTRQHARTLAIDPSTGNVYLTSVTYGVEMNTPFTNGSPATMKVAPVDSSFQVLVVGN